MKTLVELYRDHVHDCDKGSTHSYLEIYEELLAPYRRPGVRVLEVGVFKGGSLRLWEKYFADGEVHGIDLNDQPLGLADLRPMLAEGGHSIHLLDAADGPAFDRHLGRETRFDVIIEDASHAVSQQVAIFKNLRSRLAYGGLYVIEDIENLDHDRAMFEALDPAVEIIDRRRLKNRFDDVLAVFYG